MLPTTELPIEEGLLKKFTHERSFQKFATLEEEKAFQELQYYNLLRINAEGKIRITQKGEYALNVGVRSYLVNQRLHEKLMTDSFRGKGKNSLFTLGFVLLLLLIGAIFGMIISSFFN